MRESAVKIAGYFAFAECIDLLLECCRDPEERVRRASIEYLPYLEDDRVLPTLARALQNETPQVRAAAARALAQIDSEIAFPYLKSALADADSWVRYYAARSVGLHGYAEAFEDLTQLILEDEAIHVRVSATEALGKVGGARACPLLASLATQSTGEEDLARTAIAALGLIKEADALAPLLSVLRTSDSARRIEALRVLGQRGGSEAVEAMQWVAAGDGDPSVVQAAIEALGQLRNSASIAALIELTADPQRVSACTIALSHSDATSGVFGEQAIEWLGVGLTHPNPVVRSSVVDALTRLKHPRASAILIAALEDREPSVRLRAIRALGYLGNRTAEQQLAVLARTDADPAVRRAAHKAMQSSKQ